MKTPWMIEEEEDDSAPRTKMKTNS